MPGHFDLWTVFFSFVIACLAGFVAFESIGHTRDSTSPSRWTMVSGITLGLGIWSMHFIGMLAWEPPFSLYYSLGRTLISVLAAIASSWLAMRVIETHKPSASPLRLMVGALFVGAGICGMHYIGMSALHFTKPVLWSRPWLWSSFAIAVLASMGALELLRRSGVGVFSVRRQVAASLVIGVAICGMHYAGMKAMMLQDGSTCVPEPGSFSGPTLARVGVGNALLFTVGLLVVFYRDKLRLVQAASEARFQAQEASRNAERLGAAGRIAASVAHEINNPLEAVTNLLYLVEQGRLGPAERDYLNSAQSELRRIAEITTHTLKFYRQHSAASATNIAELMDSALVLFARRIGASGVRVERQAPPGGTDVVCRAGEIRQVLANLIGNAIDAMPQGGTLSLAVYPGSRGAEIVVSDTGPGIPEEAQKRILEPFFTTKGLGGTGLGLSICAEIVQRHHGTLHFTSNVEPGRSGTTFHVFLPFSPEEQEGSPDAALSAAGQTGAKDAGVVAERDIKPAAS